MIRKLKEDTFVRDIEMKILWGKQATKALCEFIWNNALMKENKKEESA